jgi:hypothetical protein
MKKIILSLVAIATISLSVLGQAPEGFKYQAVVRDAGNLILNNQAVGMRLTVQQGSIGGTAVYTETFATTTNAYGLVNLEIGTGTTTDDFATIDWANGPYFMETAVDFLGGMTWVVMGTSQLMSVPYALYAETAENTVNDLVNDADSDPTNEMNTGVALNGTDLEITDGNGTIVTDLSSLQDGVNDADSDPTNEMNTGVALNGTDLEITDGNGTIVTDLSSLQDGVNDADFDPTNEMNTGVALNGTDLEITDGNGTIVTDLSSLQDGVNDADSDPTNEMNTGVVLTGTDLEITDGNGTIVTDLSSLKASTCDLSIGDTYQGGIIFYLEASACHGLISAPTDQSAGIRWHNGSNTNTTAFASCVGCGGGNTSMIVHSQGTGSYAAKLCYDLSLGGYDDWYLPSKYELNLMFYNIGAGNALGLGNIAGFSNTSYWSSTESADYLAWLQLIGVNGNAGQGAKVDNYYYVRAIRAF